MVSAPAGVPDDVAARLTRLLGETSPAGTISAYLFGSHAEHRAHRESDKANCFDLHARGTPIRRTRS